MKIGILGASGLVGNELLQILATDTLPVSELRLMASDSSVGKELRFKNESVKLLPSTVESARGLDLCFSAIANELAEEIIPPMLADGVSVIDKSSVFRLNQNVPLIVAGVNDSDLHETNYQPTVGKLVANPNCSTIQFALAINPIHHKFGLKHVFVSTYQSVSGAGRDVVQQYRENLKPQVVPGFCPSASEALSMYAGNVVPSIGGRNANGQNSEEYKLVAETKKILHDHDFPIMVHACRVSVEVGHSEAITLMLKEAASLDELERVLSNSQYIRYCPNFEGADPTPLSAYLDASDAVLVGRLRPEVEYRSNEDSSKYHCFSMFCAANNLRVGAALNAVRIAKMIHNKQYHKLGV